MSEIYSHANFRWWKQRQYLKHQICVRVSLGWKGKDRFWSTLLFLTLISDDGHRESFRNVGVWFVTIFNDVISKTSDSCRKYIFRKMWLVLCCGYTNYLTCFVLSRPSSKVSSYRVLNLEIVVKIKIFFYILVHIICVVKEQDACTYS
jgi:hypothetical protein